MSISTCSVPVSTCSVLCRGNNLISCFSWLEVMGTRRKYKQLLLTIALLLLALPCYLGSDTDSNNELSSDAEEVDSRSAIPVRYNPRQSTRPVYHVVYGTAIAFYIVCIMMLS